MASTTPDKWSGKGHDEAENDATQDSSNSNIKLPLHQTLDDSQQHQQQWDRDRKEDNSSQEEGANTEMDVDIHDYQSGKRLFESDSPASKTMKDIDIADAIAEDPMLSILNVVVDHVMVPPCPLEPEEFDLFWRQRRTQKDAAERFNKAKSDNDETDAAAAAAAPVAADANVNSKKSFPQHLTQQSQPDKGDNSMDGLSEVFPSPPDPPNERILVPVLRFFGPVLRGDPANIRSVPRQSGCLHVHGAYPYLLARPVVAGPDGSSYRRSGAAIASQASHRIDWDDADSVALILDEIHAKLEGALRASEEWRAKRDNLVGVDGNRSDNTTKSSDKDDATTEQPQQQPPLRYIRQISVVTGRGFYTYCSGPPAPFLRIEYYDPKSKWKVKLMLEKGLDVDEAYHPDARFYDYGGGETKSHEHDSDDTNEDGERQTSCPPLKFRCYEAHIPYTMQVFKDLNLSGLSYVKVKNGLFRRSLPKKERKRTWSSANQESGREAATEAALFLDSNVFDRDQWDAVMKSESYISSQTPTHSSGPLTDNGMHIPQQCSHMPVGGLSQSETSGADMNSSPPESAWRLLRSSLIDLPLEEQYWTSKDTLCDVELDTYVNGLLNINDVMTSLPEDPAERARVHWRAVPSLREIWELERRRMSSLLSKEEDFLNSDEQNASPLTLTVKGGASVPGAQLASKGVRKLYKPSPGLEDDYRRALGDIVERHKDFVDGVDKDLKDGPIVFSSKSIGLTTPSSSQDEALAALNALGDQFGGSVEQGQLNSQEPARSPLFSSLSPQTPNSRGSSSIRSSPISEVAPFTQGDMELVHEATKFGDRIERGEVVLEDSKGHSLHVDPFTLAPYVDDDDVEEGNGGNVFDEEDKLGEEGFARSLSILATQQAASDEHEQGDSEMLETQHEYSFSVGAVGMGRAFFSQNDRAIDTIHEENDEHYNTYTDDYSGDDDETRVYQSSPEDLSSADVSAANVESKASTQDEAEPLISQCTSVRKGSFIVPRATVPRRSQCKLNAESAHWHPVHKAAREDRSQPWLRLSAAYGAQTSHPVLGYSSHSANVFVEPVSRPPSARQMAIWIKKRQKRNRSASGTSESSTKQTQQQGNSSKGGELEIDGNSRKLIAATKGSRKRKRVGFADDLVQSSCQVFAIEEVGWDDDSEIKSQFSQSPSQSQLSLESLSQDAESPKVFEDEKKQSQDEDVVKSTPSPRLKDSPCGARKMQAYSVIDPSCTMGNVADSSSLTADALEGIGQQGGRIHVAGGGALKGAVDTENNNETNHLSSAPTPVTIMSIEVHVQCRTGKAGAHDSKTIAMKPDPTRDKVASCVYVYARDPGGGVAIEVLERGVLFTPVEAENAGQERIEANLIVRKSLGISLDRAKMELVRNERQLLLRLASIVKWKDPDALMSWDTQGGGLGYLIERGVALAKNSSDGNEGAHEGSTGKGKEIDMVKLLGRIIKKSATSPSTEESDNIEWSGSGLGSEWDDRVGAGAAASSIEGRLVICGWKMIAEEVKHPNSSYLPAMVATVLCKRIPHHDDLILTRWYSAENGRHRRRVLEHRLAQATATLLLFDALDVIGRAGEAARLSGVEFSQSLPGIRGSQYKVEGCLLRALQSVWSDERGEKRGKNKLKSSYITQPNASKNSASLSADSSSQAESPWKLQRGLTAQKAVSSRNASQRAEESSVDATDRGYFFYSPSKEDCGNQEALECQAMTLEPQSGFHFDPIVVCDFTALYPSLIIAYNLCYSSCSGKLDYHTTRKEMRREGRTTSRLGPFHYAERRTAAVLRHHMKSLLSSTGDARKDKDRAYVIPTGTLFVSETVVKGVLPQVLDEILATRAMLKRAAKTYKKHVPNVAPSVLRSLEAKQLALKYVANVTYGYTSATFSGRSAMPLLADAIVECGRRTLTNAIELANRWGRDGNSRWHGAHVVYGDTDSVFIKLPNRSVEEAFVFGETFCKAVTAANPPPVQLKLEKVYVASLLQTKKKYCGMKYESPHDKRPVFEAKGIETVRRDQCALTQKVLRNALITIFQSGLDATKSYIQRQWALIHAGRLPISDYILTGRVRSHYRGGKIGPVQAALARRLAEADPGRTVWHKERIPYVIVAAPGLNFRLRDCVLTPTECLEQWDAYTIHAGYYIKKHVNAALQRCFGLPPFRIDVNAWYEASPKPRKRIHHWPVTRTGASAMITAHFGSDSCALCGQKCKAKGSARAVVCASCSHDKVAASFLGMERLNKAEQEADAVASVCRGCNGCPESLSTFAMEKVVASRTRGSNGGGVGGIVRRTSSKAASAGVITPLANCVCIDCPMTYERHRLREAQIEAEALCKALELF